MVYLKPRIWIMGIFMVLMLALSACGGQVETVGEEAPVATEAPAEEPAEEPTEEPAEEPTEEPAEKPTEEPAEQPAEEEAAAPAGDAIKLGALAPLSAPGTVVGGEAMRDAMNIAIDELNASGGILGRPVELVVVDSEGLPERGTAVMEKLINQDEVVAVGGGYHSSVGVAAKEVAHDNGIPIVFAETWNDTITSSKLPEVFRIAPLSSEVSAVDVKFIQSLPGIEKVVIVTENTDYGIPAAEDTTNGLAEAGIEAVTFGVDIGTQDFAGIVERVKAENPDMMMVLATGEAAYNFQQQAADAGIGPNDVPMLCNQVSLESDAFWTNVPDGNYCFVRKVGLPTDLYNDVAKAFVATYTEKTGKSAAESYALEAYDSIMIIAQAIEEAGTTDSAAIIDALENIEYEGALGTITFPYGQQNPIPDGVEDKFWHQFPDPAITIVQYQEQGQDSESAPVVFPALYSTGDVMLVGPDGPTAVTIEAGSEDAVAEEEAPAEASGEPIILGGLAPLSAPGTVVGGEAMREAMKIAIDDLNASGGILGRPVELVVVDTEGLPERGTAVMEKLINQDQVVAVGGGYHSSVGVAAKEVAHDNGIPVVFAETWNDTITSSKLPEIFRIAPLSSEVSAVDVKFIQNLPGIEKVAIVTENTDYGIPAAEDTTNGLAEAGIDAVTFGVDIGTQDFAGIVERVKAEQPDLIMVLATGEAAYNFQQQAADAGIGPNDLPMLCNQVSLESDAFWTNVPDGNNCFVRKVGLPTELYNDVAKAFVATYTEQTGKSAAESYALEAYDSIMIIAQAIEEAGTTDPAAIIDALENIEYEGALGTITFPYGQQNPIPDGVEDKFWHQFPDPAITIVQYQEQGQDSESAPVVFPALYSTGDAMLVGPDGPTPITIEGASEDAAAEEEAPAEASGEPIILGGLAPLSAPGTVVGGEAMREAMKIAIDDLNASGGILGRPVELVVVDTEGLPERGTAVMEKLINQDEVVAVGGGYHSSVGVAAKEVAHDNGIPVVFAETWNDTITSSKLPEIFRIAPLSSEVSAVDVKFIQSLPGIEKVAILTENTDYGIPAAEDTTNGLAEAGIGAVTFGVDIGTQDFAGIVERVKAEQPDLIMVLATGEAAYNFQQQAADAGIGPNDLPMLCNQVSLESDAFWTNVPDGNNCFVRKVGLPTDLYNDVAKAFVATYTERTGKSAAESYALEAYDSIMIIAQAIEEAGTTDPAIIIDALENIEYEGALGTITFPYGQQNPIPEGVEDKFWHQFPDPAITIVQYQEQGQDSEQAPVVFPELYKTGDAVLVGQ